MPPFPSHFKPSSRIWDVVKSSEDNSIEPRFFLVLGNPRDCRGSPAAAWETRRQPDSFSVRRQPLQPPTTEPLCLSHRRGVTNELSVSYGTTCQRVCCAGGPAAPSAVTSTAAKAPRTENSKVSPLVVPFLAMKVNVFVKPITRSGKSMRTITDNYGDTLLKRVSRWTRERRALSSHRRARGRRLLLPSPLSLRPARLPGSLPGRDAAGVRQSRALPSSRAIGSALADATLLDEAMPSPRAIRSAVRRPAPDDGRWLRTGGKMRKRICASYL